MSLVTVDFATLSFALILFFVALRRRCLVLFLAFDLHLHKLLLRDLGWSDLVGLSLLLLGMLLFR